MSRKRKNSLPFDSRGGVITIQRRLVSSDNYQQLKPQAKALMTLLQMHWRNDKLVDYGVREAAERIPCDRRTVSKAFKQLEERGFVTLESHSLFSSRTQSKSRSWRLNWMPFNYMPPSNEWEKWASEN